MIARLSILIVAGFLVACVSKDATVSFPEPALPALKVGGGQVVIVEPFVDGRGMATFGRMRNGYLWPMAPYVSAPDESVSSAATNHVVKLLRNAGFDATLREAHSGPELVVRGRVLRAYADFIYTVQTTTRLQVDLWLRDKLVETRIYEGFSHPFELAPAQAGTKAFLASFDEMYAAMCRDLPPRVLQGLHGEGAPR